MISFDVEIGRIVFFFIIVFYYLAVFQCYYEFYRIISDMEALYFFYFFPFDFVNIYTITIFEAKNDKLSYLSILKNKIMTKNTKNFHHY